MNMQTQCFDLTNAELKEENLKHPLFTTGAEFEDALKRLGVFPGIKVVVHTRFSSFGQFENGPENFCAILKRLITEDGLLMMPALTAYPADGEKYCFDPQNTPVRVGIAAETFRKQPDVLRSWDPTHSFCVWGKDKLRFVRDHYKLPTMHRKSPLGLLEEAGGYCLLAGCPEAPTFMHVVETTNDAPCLGSRSEEYPALIGGKAVKLRGWGWRDGHCRAWEGKAVYRLMREAGTLAETMVARCHLMFFRLSDFRTAYEVRLHDPSVGCAACPIRPRKVKQSLPGDWDFVHDRLGKTEAFSGDYQG